MERHRFANTDLSVPIVGLGCYGMSGAYGPADNAESIATIRRALDLGGTQPCLTARCGGFAMAIGAALCERLVYAEDGGFVTGSLFDYALPTANAVGKDFLPGGRVVAPAPGGSGFQVSLYGLIGILFAAREGLEVSWASVLGSTRSGRR